jgi:hypothetical protein
MPANMKSALNSTACLVWLSAVLLGSSLSISAVTLEQLRKKDQLTPEQFAAYFKDFEFELLEEVQPPEIFLARRSGDCDDYATLAADILKEKGYTPKLVVVFMPRDVHVVCYIPETKSYLDYNLRNRNLRTVPSDGTLTDIAQKVAKSFNSTWYCVSEFTFTNGNRHFVYTDFPQVR